MASQPTIQQRGTRTVAFRVPGRDAEERDPLSHEVPGAAVGPTDASAPVPAGPVAEGWLGNGKPGDAVDPSQIKLCDLPEDAAEILGVFDVNENGVIDVNELALGAQAYKAQQEQNRLMRTALIFMSIFFLCLCGTMTGLTYAIVQANKDTSASAGGALTGKESGTAVGTSSSDTVVVNGKSVPRTLIADLVAADQAANGGPTTTRRRLMSGADNSLAALERAWQVAPAGFVRDPTTGRRSRRLQQDTTDPNALPPPGTGTEPVDSGSMTSYNGDTQQNNTSSMPTGGVTAVQDSSVEGNIDSYSNITEDQLTEAMMQFADQYGGAETCSESFREFAPLNSLMNPDYWLWLRAFELEQGPVRAKFDVVSIGVLPRCARESSPDPSTNPCDTSGAPEAYEMLVMVDLARAQPECGSLTLLLDREQVRFPVTAASPAAGCPTPREFLRGKGFAVSDTDAAFEGGIAIGWFANHPDLGHVRCADGSGPQQADGVCGDVLTQVNNAPNEQFPWPELVNGSAGLYVDLKGSVIGSGVPSTTGTEPYGFNHNGVRERFESVAVRPGTLDGFACNPYATSAPGQARPEMWHLHDMVGAHGWWAGEDVAGGQPTTAAAQGNMVRQFLRLNGAAFTPGSVSLCRYFNSLGFPNTAAFNDTTNTSTFGTNANNLGESILFVANDAGKFKLYAMDPNLPEFLPDAAGALKPTNNVRLISDLQVPGLLATGSKPRGMYVDRKFQEVFLTLENMLVRVKLNATAFPAPAEVIVNSANLGAADVRANSATMDGPLLSAKLTQPQGVAGRLNFPGAAATDLCAAPEGCLLVADTGANRIRLVDLGPRQEVLTAIGDGNARCNPMTFDSTTLVDAEGSPQPENIIPCSANGFVFPAADEFFTSGGWANYPGNLPPDIPIADVDRPMQIFIDAGNQLDTTDGPPLWIFFTESTSNGDSIRLVGGNAEVRTLVNLRDVFPPEHQAPNMSSATMAKGWDDKKWLFGTFSDGTIGRTQIELPFGLNAPDYNDGYDPNAPYATNNDANAPQRRRRFAKSK